MEPTTEDAERELRQLLDELTYPADKVSVVTCIEIRGLSTDIRRRLHHLPHRRYSSSSEVAAALPTSLTKG
ncbi:hypothetical protein ACFWNN_02185 [Lentzea sp. NPDC058450]|uniref:DUF2795 domain-containing protein n=1 Tax=Lentzea sp. NPDC058450 TaxID=3346505 RepID=UPI00364E7128